MNKDLSSSLFLGWKEERGKMGYFLLYLLFF